VSKKILIADDEAHIRHIVSMKLSNAGYETVTAADGEEALELFQAEAPDLVITDYQMPYLSGMELCQRLLEAHSSSPTPVLMLTARGFDITGPEMAAAGITEVLLKPFSPREILAKVRALLGDEPPAEETGRSA